MLDFGRNWTFDHRNRLAGDMVGTQGRQMRGSPQKIEYRPTPLPGPLKTVYRWMRDDFVEVFARHAMVFATVIFFIGLLFLAFGIVTMYHKLPEITAAAGRLHQ